MKNKIFIGAALDFEFEALKFSADQAGFNPILISHLRPSCTFRKPESDFEIVITSFGFSKTHFFDSAIQVLSDEKSAGHLICTGGAGALKEGLEIGDVVGATFINDSSGLGLTTKPNLEILEHEVCDTKRIEKLGKIQGHNFGIHLGGITTVDQPVFERTERQSLRNQSHALAVAMEGTGGALAARKVGISFNEIRLITDVFGEKISISEYKTRFKKFAPNLLKTILECI